MSARFDLHTHTVHSDGTTTPQDNAGLARDAGLAGLALTDHDTVAGWAQMRDACARAGLTFVPGIELSTERDGRSVHLLGYWVDPDHAGLVDECDRLRNERSRRAEQITERLAELGTPIELERVRELAGDAPIGRPHIASAMVEAGHVDGLQQAFDDYLADGGPAYVPKYAVDPVDGVRLLRDAGGAVVLAHPGVSEDGGGPVTPELLGELVRAGVHGLEVDHPGHDGAALARWGGLADEHDLIVTGASDFHGERKDLRLGERTTGAAALDRLASAAEVAVDSTVSGATTGR